MDVLTSPGHTFWRSFSDKLTPEAQAGVVGAGCVMGAAEDMSRAKAIPAAPNAGRGRPARPGAQGRSGLSCGS
jgi:hypothetical protein